MAKAKAKKPEVVEEVVEADETPEHEEVVGAPVESVKETAVKEVDDEPVTFAEVAAKGGEFFKALRRLGTRPVKDAIGKGADTVIDALDELAGDRKRPKQ